MLKIKIHKLLLAITITLSSILPTLSCEKSLLNDDTLKAQLFLSPEQSEGLLSTFPSSEIISNDESQGLVVNIKNLNEDQRNTLKNDLDFLKANPELPLENIFCTLENYAPQNESQKTALEAAKRLIEVKPKQGAGLYLEGSMGLGKTHLAVAVAKEFFRRGLRVLYLNSNQSNIGAFDKDTSWLNQYDVFILDDFNEGYHPYTRNPFTKIVYKVHSKGGKLFVTTNSTYEKFIEEAIESKDRGRYRDRTKSMFKILRLDGESFRKDAGWM